MRRCKMDSKIKGDKIRKSKRVLGKKIQVNGRFPVMDRGVVFYDFK